MSDLPRRVPLHPWLVALYPVAALLAHNVTQVQPSVALRPALLSLGLATLLFAILWLLTRNAGRAALYTSLLLVVFLTYGAFYRFLRELSGDALLGRHRYLIPLYLGLLASAIWGVRRIQDLSSATQALNLVALVLLALPMFQLFSYYRSDVAGIRRVRAAGTSDHLTYAGQGAPPDVYFIVLDAYTRGDALRRDMQFDNSEFLTGLEDLGFYVAECGRPNYDFTRASLTSTLNMDYLPALRKELAAQGLTDYSALWALLLNSKTRRLFQEMGYRTVAFQTTYSWTEDEDADIYLAPGRDWQRVQQLLPFEAMLLKGTAALILTDSGARFFNRAAQVVNFPFDYHAQTELHILDTLPKLAEMPGPKFVFVHILIPHTPYVFEPDGTVRTDPNYFSAPGMHGVTWKYERDGYVDSVQFINSRILPILKTLIDESPTPPIIVMEGDHGWGGKNRTQNLSTYYLPGGNTQGLYPSISSVNSFRLIFNNYFGAGYDLLPDETYTGFSLKGEGGRLVPETAPECLP